MKILLTTDAVGGVWEYAVTLYRRLDERGHDVLLAVLGQPTADRLASLPRGARWIARPFALEWTEEGLREIEPAARWIASLADGMGADVVHLNQLAYAHRISRPTVVVVHSDAWSWFSEVRGCAPPDEPRWADYRRAVTRGLHAADHVVAPSRYQAELTKRHYGRSADQVILNGIDGERFAAPRRIPAAAGHVRSGRAPSTLVTLGRAWDEAKGHKVVDEALGLVSEPWSAYLAGDIEGPQGQRLNPRWLKHLGRLPGSGVRQLLGRSDVYVGASLYEPFGLAPVEAAMAGCALLLSDIPSFRELWGPDALYFRPGDAISLAEALDRLRSDEGLHRDLRLRAGRRARTRFDDRQTAARYVRLYEALASAARPLGVRGAGRAYSVTARSAPRAGSVSRPAPTSERSVAT